MDDEAAAAVESGETVQAAICTALAERGFAVLEELVPSDEIAALRAEAERRSAAGELRAARTGRGSRAQRDAVVRGDAISWLDAARATPPERALLARWDALRRALNRELFLGLVELEAHFARYEPGAGYARHLDRFRDDDARAISLVLYLNEDWREADGGALRIFASERASEPVREVLPRAGTLVAMRSDEIAHEVAPARRVRLSIAGWLRRRSAPASAR